MEIEFSVKDEIVWHVTKVNSEVFKLAIVPEDFVARLEVTFVAQGANAVELRLNVKNLR
jgi:hypothetical protein